MTPPPRNPFPLVVKVLAVLMTSVVSGLGLLAMITAHAPERWTRHGYVAPLEGTDAQSFGASIFFFGLMPLMLVARNQRVALWIGVSAAVLGVVSLFAGLVRLP